MKSTARLWVLMSLGLLLCAPESRAQTVEDDASILSIVGESLDYPPFQVFDNLHYVGIGWVAAWLVDTSDGLVLIDTLYGRHTDALLSRIRECGFNPRDVKYVFVTHAHFDHCGGVARIKEATGATIGMTPADWCLFYEEADGLTPLTRFETIPVDLVFYEDDQITLGDTTFTFHVTPGHTEGVLSIGFPVRDGTSQYNAFTFGGAGLNFLGTRRTRQYLDSVDRLLEMENIQVNVPNHPSNGKVFWKELQLLTRQPNEPHPFVDEDGFREFLEDRRDAAERKLSRGNLEDAILRIFHRKRDSR